MWFSAYAGYVILLNVRISLIDLAVINTSKIANDLSLSRISKILYYYNLYTSAGVYLKRGHIVLIVGGATAVISFSMLGYYTLQFVNIIQQEGKHRIDPGGSINVEENINNTQGIGIYAIALAEFSGSASVIIIDNGGNTIVNKSITQPVVIEPFSTESPGIYTLHLLNPTDQMLEAAIGFGDQHDVLSRRNDLSFDTVLLLVSTLVVGVVLAIAGVIITILDRRKINKMKQFGDTSDLI
jgi:hypothetical protein